MSGYQINVSMLGHFLFRTEWEATEYRFQAALAELVKAGFNTKPFAITIDVRASKVEMLTVEQFKDKHPIL